jgi:hypothetical protein
MMDGVVDHLALSSHGVRVLSQEIEMGTSPVAPSSYASPSPAEIVHDPSVLNGKRKVDRLEHPSHVATPAPQTPIRLAR